MSIHPTKSELFAFGLNDGCILFFNKKKKTVAKGGTSSKNTI